MSGYAAPMMSYLNNGNVGINNTDPNAPLVVQGATGTGALKLIAPSVASGDNWWLGFGHGTTSTDANDRARIGAEIIAGGSGRLFFTTGSTGSQTRAMFIDENQRVGIGTSAPTAQLEVATMNGLSAIIRRGGSTPQTPANIILQKTSGANPNTEGALVNGDFIGRILFSASNGTSSPTNGTDIVGYAVGTQSTTNNGGGIFFRTVPLNSVNQSIERMRIEHNGNVGIGTGSPSERLHVIGNIAASGTVSASGTVLTSDARLKSKVVGIDNGLRKIMQLNPVNYDKKIALDSTATVNENGFIAQELQKIMPELVSEGNDKDKLLSVNYMAIIPVLTKAIQEQQALIEMQQQQINELKIAVDKMNKK